MILKFNVTLTDKDNNNKTVPLEYDVENNRGTLIGGDTTDGMNINAGGNISEMIKELNKSLSTYNLTITDIETIYEEQRSKIANVINEIKNWVAN